MNGLISIKICDLSGPRYELKVNDWAGREGLVPSNSQKAKKSGDRSLHCSKSLQKRLEVEPELELRRTRPTLVEGTRVTHDASLVENIL